MNFTFNNQFKAAVQRTSNRCQDASDVKKLIEAQEGLTHLSIAATAMLDACDQGQMVAKDLQGERLITALRGALADMGYVPPRIGTPSFKSGVANICSECDEEDRHTDDCSLKEGGNVSPAE